jgi:hypothetical protein
MEKRKIFEKYMYLFQEVPFFTFIMVLIAFGCRDSVIDVEARYWLESPGIESR